MSSCCVSSSIIAGPRQTTSTVLFWRPWIKLCAEGGEPDTGQTCVIRERIDLKDTNKLPDYQSIRKSRYQSLIRRITYSPRREKTEQTPATDQLLLENKSRRCVPCPKPDEARSIRMCPDDRFRMSCSPRGMQNYQRLFLRLLKSLFEWILRAVYRKHRL